jgi:hypothetical protein
VSVWKRLLCDLGRRTALPTPEAEHADAAPVGDPFPAWLADEVGDLLAVRGWRLDTVEVRDGSVRLDLVRGPHAALLTADEVDELPPYPWGRTPPHHFCQLIDADGVRVRTTKAHVQEYVHALRLIGANHRVVEHPTSANDPEPRMTIDLHEELRYVKGALHLAAQHGRWITEHEAGTLAEALALHGVRFRIDQGPPELNEADIGRHSCRVSWDLEECRSIGLLGGDCVRLTDSNAQLIAKWSGGSVVPVADLPRDLVPPHVDRRGFAVRIKTSTAAVWPVEAYAFSGDTVRRHRQSGWHVVEYGTKEVRA